MQLEPGEVPQQRVVRFRSLGCYPLSAAIDSTGSDPRRRHRRDGGARESERAGRLIDGEGGASMEAKKVEGYF